MTDVRIDFTQYLRPHGMRTDVYTVLEDTDDTLGPQYQKIKDNGYVFECEVLTNGMVSLTIHDPEKETDIAHELCNNGPEVPGKIRKLITDFKLHHGN